MRGLRRCPLALLTTLTRYSIYNDNVLLRREKRNPDQIFQNARSNCFWRNGISTARNTSAELECLERCQPLLMLLLLRLLAGDNSDDDDDDDGDKDNSDAVGLIASFAYMWCLLYATALRWHATSDVSARWRWCVVVVVVDVLYIYFRDLCVVSCELS